MTSTGTCSCGAAPDQAARGRHFNWCTERAPWVDELRQAERDAMRDYDPYEDGRPTRGQANIDAAVDTPEPGE